MVVAAAVAPGIVIHESMTKFVVLSAICLATAVAIGYPFASVMYRRLYNSAKHYNDTAYRPEKASWDREADLPFGSSAILGSFVASAAVRRRGGGEDPWLCGPGFRRVCLCRGMVRLK